MATNKMGKKPSIKRHKLKTAKTLSGVRTLRVRPPNTCPFGKTMGCPEITT